jgi:hypothetical protein
MNYQKAQAVAASWVADCVQELKRRGMPEPVVSEGAVIQTKDDVISTIAVGDDGVLIQMTVRGERDRLYTPVLIVTEREKRQHRVGIGHSHVYEPMQTGKPNFKKAVANAIIRAAEVAELTRLAPQPAEQQAGEAPPPAPATPAPAVDLRKAATEELRGVKVPTEFMVARRADGTYTLHCGTIKLTLEQLIKVCAAANAY